MSDDTSYATFLTKANADPASGTRSDTANAQSTSAARSRYDPSDTSSTDAALPAALRDLPSTIQFVSDTDSPFEPALFSYAADELPSADGFRRVLKVADGTGVEVLETKEFDPRGEYGEVLERVERAGEGKGKGKGVRVFRVQAGGARVEYYVLTVADRKLVGFVTKAVES